MPMSFWFSKVLECGRSSLHTISNNKRNAALRGRNGDQHFNFSIFQFFRVSKEPQLT